MKIWNRTIFNSFERVKLKIPPALADLDGEKKVEIRSKSGYLFKVISEWMPKWKANGWKGMDGDEIRDLEQVKLLDAAMAGMEVRVVSAFCT